MIMISYRKLIPCIYIAGGKAIKWFDDREVLADNVVELAKHYSDRGADELLIFDLQILMMITRIFKSSQTDS